VLSALVKLIRRAVEQLAEALIKSLAGSRGGKPLNPAAAIVI
jgi:hypothetical protein